MLVLSKVEVSIRSVGGGFAIGGGFVYSGGNGVERVYFIIGGAMYHKAMMMIMIGLWRALGLGSEAFGQSQRLCSN